MIWYDTGYGISPFSNQKQGHTDQSLQTASCCIHPIHESLIIYNTNEVMKENTIIVCRSFLIEPEEIIMNTRKGFLTFLTVGKESRAIFVYIYFSLQTRTLYSFGGCSTVIWSMTE